MRAEQLYDWSLMTGLLAEQGLSSTPGEVGAYHSITQGYLVGEVVRRATGRSLATFFADEVAGPLGADFHLGLPATAWCSGAPAVGADGVARLYWSTSTLVSRWPM
jgi:CubicO group peptidase (beta-lactamase class C family)